MKARTAILLMMVACVWVVSSCSTGRQIASIDTTPPSAPQAPTVSSPTVENIFFELVQRYAPQLRFDSGSAACAGPDVFPMSAQEYYDEIIRNGSYKAEDRKYYNTNPNTVRDNLVPTYWKAFWCGKQLRIVYWFFYGWQPSCDCFDLEGGHNGDWERVMVVLSEDTTRLAVVTFWQHSGWYTRYAKRGGFATHEGTHPVVYPGRRNHGSYHDSGESIVPCAYYQDHRDGKGPCWNTWLGPLIELRPSAEGGEEWMDADMEGGFHWGYDGVSNHPTINNQANCSMYAWNGTPGGTPIVDDLFENVGWRKTQCEISDRDTDTTCWHCASGWTDLGAICERSMRGKIPIIGPLVPEVHNIKTYGKDYRISNSDAGLLYSIKGW